MKLIDAYALEEHIADRYGYPAADILHEIATFPTVDAVPAVHVRVFMAEEREKIYLDFRCGICGNYMLATDDFCPMCGAMNDGERE